MKSILIQLVLVVMLLPISMPVNALIGFEVRSPVGYVIDGSEYVWGPDEFSPFFYDFDKDFGTERLEVTISDGDKLDKNSGIEYITEAQKTSFEFDEAADNRWGEYWIVGFLGQKCFAGYVETPYAQSNSYLAYKSDIDNLIEREHLSKILIDKNTYFELTRDSPLMLDEEYELAIEGWSMEDKKNRLRVKLLKKGSSTPLHTEIIESHDYTYTYKKNDYLGDGKGAVIIAIHFDYVLRDPEKAVIDGIWQISEDPIEVDEGREYGKMKIEKVDGDMMKIVMSNKERISIKTDKYIPLMGDIREFSLNGDIGIKTADQDVTAQNPLRFYISRKIREPGSYEIRSNVKLTGDGDVSFDASSFPGFYYDLDDDIKTETLRMSLTDEIDLEEDTGVEYITEAEVQRHEFEGWGKFKVIGFLGGKFFSSYVEDEVNGSYLYSKSKDHSDLMEGGLLSEVLMDYDDDYVEELTKKAGESLTLMEGYKLKIESVDIQGDKVTVLLLKNDKILEDAIVQPSRSGATMGEKTYVYSTSLCGDSDEELVIIAIHFEDAFRGPDDHEYATIDGIWQISDTPTKIAEQKFGKMVVDSFDSEKIVLINEGKEGKMRLKSNCDSPLMGNIMIKTSSQDETPRRFYLYKAAYVYPHEIDDDHVVYLTDPVKYI